MKFFRKKDKRYYSSTDNYTDKYLGTFKLGLFYIFLLGIGYFFYTMYNWFI